MITLHVKGIMDSSTMYFNESLSINNIKAHILYETLEECDIIHNQTILAGHLTIKEANLH